MLDIFKKSQVIDKNVQKETLIKITSLLIHAAKIDDNYSEKEKLIIINFLKTLDMEIDFDDVVKKAEDEEKNSSHILEFTQEIKKNTMDFRIKIIKTLWEIILSDDKSDMYESTLMRRIAGLLYVPDKLIGETKLEVLNKK